MTTKSELEQIILNAITHNTISGQLELKIYLKNIGHDIPQATLSRYLRKLKIIKVDNKYQVIAPASTQELLPIVRIDVSEIGLIVIHTPPGHASSVAFFVDKNYVAANSHSLIMGTIAGDDTILIIPKKKSDLPEILSLLSSHINMANL